MKHLERALDGQNNFWKYLCNFVASLLGGSMIGSIPLMILIADKTIQNNGAIAPNPANALDFTAYGISLNVGLALMMLPFVTGLITAILLLRPLHKRTFAEVVNGTKSIRWKRAFTGFGIWLVIAALYFAIDYAISPANYVLQFDLAAFLPLLLISVLLIPIQTTFEELLYRGYLGQAIGAWTKNRWLVVIIPAILFGLSHYANPEIKEYGFWMAMPQYIMFGLVFGLITVLDDGIEVSMGLHAANNIFASLMITNKASVLQTQAVFSQQNIDPNKETLALLVMSIVFIAILKYHYKWDFKVLNKKVEKQEPEIIVE